MERYRYAGIVDVFGPQESTEQGCEGVQADAVGLLGPCEKEEYGIEHHVAVPTHDATHAVLAIYAAELKKWIDDHQKDTDLQDKLMAILESTRKGYVQFPPPRDLGVAGAVYQLPIRHKAKALSAGGYSGGKPTGT